MGLYSSIYRITIVVVLVGCGFALLAGCGSQDDITPAAAPVSQENIAALIEEGGCGGCHVIPGIANAVGETGPSWCEPAKEFQDGEVDLEFLHEAIVDPNKEIAGGYQANIMPANFGEMYTESEIDQMATFIANLECP